MLLPWYCLDWQSLWHCQVVVRSLSCWKVTHCYMFRLYVRSWQFRPLDVDCLEQRPLVPSFLFLYSCLRARCMNLNEFHFRFDEFQELRVFTLICALVLHDARRSLLSLPLHVRLLVLVSPNNPFLKEHSYYGWALELTWLYDLGSSGCAPW